MLIGAISMWARPKSHSSPQTTLGLNFRRLIQKLNFSPQICLRAEEPNMARCVAQAGVKQCRQSATRKMKNSSKEDLVVISKLLRDLYLKKKFLVLFFSIQDNYARTLLRTKLV